VLLAAVAVVGLRRAEVCQQRQCVRRAMCSWYAPMGCLAGYFACYLPCFWTAACCNVPCCLVAWPAWLEVSASGSASSPEVPSMSLQSCAGWSASLAWMSLELMKPGYCSKNCGVPLELLEMSISRCCCRLTYAGRVEMLVP